MTKEQSTEIELIMDKNKSIVDLLIELDKVLKVETHEDTSPYYISGDSEDKILRAKYAGKIYIARRLLGLSYECKTRRIIALRASRRVFRLGE